MNGSRLKDPVKKMKKLQKIIVKFFEECHKKKIPGEFVLTTYLMCTLQLLEKYYPEVQYKKLKEDIQQFSDYHLKKIYEIKKEGEKK